MIAAAVSLFHLPVHLARLARSESFLKELVASPEDALTSDQIALLEAVGIPNPPQRD